MHQPQEASVMQARQVVYTEQSELAKGWRNCTLKGYRARKMVHSQFFFPLQLSVLLTSPKHFVMAGK